MNPRQTRYECLVLHFICDVDEIIIISQRQDYIEKDIQLLK
jgi:hypothetical protein